MCQFDGSRYGMLSMLLLRSRLSFCAIARREGGSDKKGRWDSIMRRSTIPYRSSTSPTETDGSRALGNGKWGMGMVRDFAISGFWVETDAARVTRGEI